MTAASVSWMRHRRNSQDDDTLGGMPPEKGIYFTPDSLYLMPMDEPLSNTEKKSGAQGNTEPVAKTVENALKNLVKLLSAIRFYPPGHPSLVETNQEAVKTFLLLLQNRDSFSLGVRRDHFVLGEDKIGADNPLLGKLATQLFMRRVQQLLFLPGLSPRDLWKFTQAMTLDPNEIHSRGGIQKICERLRITSIWANELDLKAALARKESLIEEISMLPEESSDESMLATDINALLDENQQGEEKGTIEASPGGAPPEERLESLLQKLRQETEDEPFRRMALQVPPLIRLCLNEAGRFPTLQALTFLGIWSRDQELSAARAGAAASALAQLTSDDILDFVIVILCTKGLADDQREQTLALLPILGPPLTLRLMTRLISESDSWARKVLSDGLMRQGKIAVAVVTGYLSDERWFVVRNCVAILGEIRDTSAVAPLEGLLHHTDVRVRRETIRALTRIGGTDAVNILLHTLEEDDLDLRRQALASLGAMKHTAAVPALLRIVAARDPRVRQLEIKREAIRALGEIGSAEAVAPLARLVVKRKFWFRDRFNELRAAAIAALGDIGHPAASEILQWATKDRSDTVARAAVQALKQFPKVESK